MQSKAIIDTLRAVSFWEDDIRRDSDLRRYRQLHSPGWFLHGFAHGLSGDFFLTGDCSERAPSQFQLPLDPHPTFFGFFWYTFGCHDNPYSPRLCASQHFFVFFKLRLSHYWVLTYKKLVISACYYEDENRRCVFKFVFRLSGEVENTCVCYDDR